MTDQKCVFKGSTINDLGGGAEEKSKTNIFFPQEGPGEGLLKFYLIVFMSAFMYQQTVNNPNFSDFYDA